MGLDGILYYRATRPVTRLYVRSFDPGSWCCMGLCSWRILIVPQQGMGLDTGTISGPLLKSSYDINVLSWVISWLGKSS